VTVEERIVCDGFIGFNVLSLEEKENIEADNEPDDIGWCAANMNILQQNDLITNGECSNFKDRCIICHNNTEHDN